MFRPYSKILPFNLITIISKFRDLGNRFIPENGPFVEEKDKEEGQFSSFDTKTFYIPLRKLLSIGS